MRTRILAGMLVAALVPVSGQADEAPIEERVQETIAAASRSLTLRDGELSGAGGDWLLERAGSSRFTLLGESHLTAETPDFTEALLRGLKPAGYSVYVVESGPVGTEIVVRTLEEGGVEAAEKLLTEVPLSVAFLFARDELHNVEVALKLGYHVWGIDQEFLGSPRLLLRELVRLAQEGRPRDLAREMLERAEAGFARFAETGDQSRSFMSTATEEDFDALESAFGDSEKALRIVDQLRASAAVYRAYTEGRYYDNNSTRIRLMKRNLLAHAESAGLSPVGDWKAVFKAGNYHMGKGHTPMKVLDVGNFASELAIASGAESFHVMVTATGRIGEDGELASWLDQAPHLAPLYERASGGQTVAIDLRPLRPVLTQARDKSEALERLEEIVLRFDAAVVFPAFHGADVFTPLPGS